MGNAWLYGVRLLVEHNCNSFYVFFTCILTEIVYIHSKFPEKEKYKLMQLLIGYIIIVLICSWLKGLTEGTRRELLVSKLYVSFLFFLFMVGLIINKNAMLFFTIIPIIVTLVYVIMGKLEDYYDLMTFCENPYNGDYYRGTFNTIIIIILYLIPLGFFICSVIWDLKIKVIPAIIIIIVYSFLVPLISFYEDFISENNVFEIAYNIYYDGDEEDEKDESNKKDENDHNDENF